MTFEAVLERFSARRSGSGWMATCPAHDDATASLSIAPGEAGRTMLNCFAGCNTEAVLAARGMTMADVQPERIDAGKPEIVANYNYTDEQGTLLFQAVRYNPKDFKQRCPDGAGGWLWKLDGVRRVLFGLPALRGQKVVYIPEGEKDVLALRALGLVATTNAGGASKNPNKPKWRTEYTEQLTAAGIESIVILPDHDAPGAAHAEAVARSCHAAGLKVTVVTLPDLPAKGDVSDWLNAGHTKPELIALVEATALYTPIMAPADVSRDPAFVLTTIGELLAEAEESVDWLVENLITAGGVAVMAAKPKVGKSTAARALALAIARGDEWLGYPCAAGVVWYLAFEGRRRDVRAHFRQMGARPSDPLRVFVGQAPKDVVAQVRRLAEQERPALIIIDTMQRFLRATSTDDYAEMTTLLDAVIGIAQQSGATVLLLHHSGKADRTSIDAVLGSTAITGSADTIILLARTDHFRTITTVQRVGDDLDETVILLDEMTGRVTLGPSRQNANETLVEDAIIAALQRADGPQTEAQLEDLVDARTALKRRALRRLVSQEQVSRAGRGGKGDPYRYAVSGSRSLVPNNKGEQQNKNDDSAVMPPDTEPDTCSHVRAQGPCSRKPREARDADGYEF